MAPPDDEPAGGADPLLGVEPLPFPPNWAVATATKAAKTRVSCIVAEFGLRRV
jgi:hypothetical protein